VTRSAHNGAPQQEIRRQLPLSARPAPIPLSSKCAAPRRAARESSKAGVCDLPSAERPRERLLASGAHALSNAELLAILLRTGVAGESVLNLAARLLAHFAGLRGLAHASVTELCALRGISVAKACQLLAALELGRREASLFPADRPVIRTPEDVDRLLRAEVAPLAQEKLCVLLLNTKQELLRVQEVYLGTVNTASVRVAEVLRPAVKDNCPNLIAVHNHPSADPDPSPRVIRIPRRLVRSAATMDICLHDLVVIAARGFVSMKRRGLGFVQTDPD